MAERTLHTLRHPVRIVTAASLFDGHDASINIMRRIMQSQGAEVIHLGHNRSVQEVVEAVVDEDANAVAISSYQGGHVEYFEYLVQQLAAHGVPHVNVVGGGGGVIVPEEIARLRESGVTIFSPEDGQRLGLPGMVNQVLAESDVDLWEVAARPTSTPCSRATVPPSPGRSPAPRPAPCRRRTAGATPRPRPRGPAACRSWASPARAARASRR